MTKKQQIIFLKGKTEGLKTLFNTDNFGYLAVGYYDGDDNGFDNPTPSQSQTDNGFQEISTNTDGTYSRIPLAFVKELEDYDTGRSICTFTATLTTSNIKNDIKLNQFAICNSMDPNDLNTTFYCASTFPTITKNDNMEISFTIDLGL